MPVSELAVPASLRPSESVLTGAADLLSEGRGPSRGLCSQGVNKDSYLILETLPTEYDSRVKAMEVDERPTEQYSDIGGLDKQIQEVMLYV